MSHTFVFSLSTKVGLGQADSSIASRVNLIARPVFSIGRGGSEPTGNDRVTVSGLLIVVAPVSVVSVVVSSVSVVSVSVVSLSLCQSGKSQQHHHY